MWIWKENYTFLSFLVHSFTGYQTNYFYSLNKKDNFTYPRLRFHSQKEQCGLSTGAQPSNLVDWKASKKINKAFRTVGHTKKQE